MLVALHPIINTACCSITNAKELDVFQVHSVPLHPISPPPDTAQHLQVGVDGAKARS